MPYSGRCHCSAIQFEVDDLPAELTYCNCSFCVRRGGLLVYYRPEQFRLKTPSDRISTYLWGDRMCQHRHCAVCGISAYSDIPSFENGVADYDRMRVVVNLRLLDDPSVWEGLPVKTVNGRDNW